ncbi:feruloyl-CoA synthase [Vandammella animalimorsus]|uniref:Feruloyl-CoA synthase n=2 Tax=Vandammella animalimorsus TaxID=2029117 RepID=A0A2A2AE73_9BURK|nr:feruloyl-CoA synthase [Vandammella animalimorsus]
MGRDLFAAPGQLAPKEVQVHHREGGILVLRSPQPLAEPVRCIGDWLEHWAIQRPEQTFLAERDAQGQWRRLSYRQVRQHVGAIAQALLDMDLPPGRPVVALSDNSIDHALLMLATMHIGRPFCTISSAYTRLAKDASRLQQMLSLVHPALLYASDASVYGPRSQEAAPDVPKVFTTGAQTIPGARGFQSLLDTRETPAVAEHFARIRPEDHAKYLLTSGSTGIPKAVINTHRMLCVNQAAIAQVWPFLHEQPPLVVDWLPWSHTFGTNHNFNMVLAHGGSLYIDEGRPLPGLLEKSVRNLREIQPNMYFNVPRGFDALVPLLEQDQELARQFFARLQLVFYAGAALSASTWSRIEAVAQRVTGRRIWFTTAWGATETAPLVTSLHWRTEQAGCIGLPVPGVELKFLPNGKKLEMRVRGQSIFPGYLHAPELTQQAFDEEGFYKIGDAGVFMEPGNPASGVVFDGRVAEDFKLSSGTWVSVGPLRVRAIGAMAPHVQDVVVTGHNREEVGLMVFLNPAAHAVPREELESALRAGLQRLHDEGAGSAQAPSRLLILDEPPDVDAGEITDKGYLNQRAILERRASQVQRLYAGQNDPQIIGIGKAGKT